MAPYNDEQKLKAVKKVLGEPVFCELSDKAWKIRTNLIIASVISISIVIADLHIDPSSTVLGLKFTGLTDTVVRSGLFWITLYLIMHFIWSAWDNLLEWRLRITGTRVSFVTAAVLASEHADHPNDPRQSTLYHWWIEEAQKIGNLAEKVSNIERQLQDWESRLQTEIDARADSSNIVNACSLISGVREVVVQLKHGIEEARQTISAYRVPVSLERFDAWFKLLLRSQNLRWFLVEFMLPILLGAAALFLLCFE